MTLGEFAQKFVIGLRVGTTLLCAVLIAVFFVEYDHAPVTTIVLTILTISLCAYVWWNPNLTYEQEYWRFRERVEENSLITAEQFRFQLAHRLSSNIPSDLRPTFLECGAEIFKSEDGDLLSALDITSPSEIGGLQTLVNPGWGKSHLPRLRAVTSDRSVIADRAELILSTIAQSLNAIVEPLPKDIATSAGFTTRLINLLPQTPAFFRSISQPFFTAEVMRQNLFEPTRRQLYLAASGSEPSLSSFPSDSPLGRLLRS